MRKSRKVFAAISCGAAMVAHAVYLDPDGLGQALIYPYYSARADAQGNPYNTYLSLVNTDSVGKVVRVRMREGSGGLEAASFNVFLSPGDMWTGAVVPDGDGAKLISADRSCTEPALTVGSSGLSELPLRVRGMPTGSDTAGPAREGFVEMIEMATIKPGSPTALAIRQDSLPPQDCALVSSVPMSVGADLDAPRGALMGTLTLINVASGLDATVTAGALSALTTRSFYRPGSDPYVTVATAEVTPASVITTGGKRYRLNWSRGVDAVTSALMNAAVLNEYILDTGMNSMTDWVVTLPTRHFYRLGADATPPFYPDVDRPQCDSTFVIYFDREERGAAMGHINYGVPTAHAPDPANCFSTSVWSIASGAAQTRPSLLGAMNLQPSHVADFQHGWMWMQSVIPTTGREPSMDALANSTSTDISTGVTTLGSLRVVGIPTAGLSVRTFSNGTLTCGSGACQGNYASAFPHRAVRSVVNMP